MRPHSILFRLTAATAVASLMLGPSLAPVAGAQAPSSAMPVAPNQATVTPPERAGRVAQISGTMSFHTADQDQWSAAAPNYPVATGNAFWTEPNTTAWLDISASRLAIAGQTELDIGSLDQNGLQATLPQGEAYLHLSNLSPNETWALQTPRGMVTVSGAGRYGVIAGDTQDPTMLTVLDGAARISGPGFSLDVAPGQTATITGADAFQAQVGPAQTDPFLAAMLRAERTPAAPRVTPPAVVAQMPGGDELAAYGAWDQTPEYGDVWYPQVPAGWVPYREGRWAYIEPWGWTWVDDEPWGFAPFHYGRWVEIHGRWAWTPGLAQVHAPPVYAPALVAFVGIGVGIGVGAALESGRVGWVPLGPREPYHPWYHAPDSYLRAVNRHDVTNPTVINQHVTINNFYTRPGATVIPARAMAESRPVRQATVRIDPHELGVAHPVVGTAPIRPTVATAGVTPRMAQRLQLPPPAAGAAAVPRIAPGPTIHAMPPARGVATRPPLPPATGRPGAGPGPGTQPFGATIPGLKQPGAAATGHESLQHAPSTRQPNPQIVTPTGPARPVMPPAAEHRVPVPAQVTQPAGAGAGHPAVLQPHPLTPAQPAPQAHPAAPVVQGAPERHVPGSHAMPAVSAPRPEPPHTVAVPHAPAPVVPHPFPAMQPHPSPAPMPHAAPAPRPVSAPHPAQAPHQQNDRRPGEH